MKWNGPPREAGIYIWTHNGRLCLFSVTPNQQGDLAVMPNEKPTKEYVGAWLGPIEIPAIPESRTVAEGGVT